MNNLIGILDVNRLGQRGPTLYENDLGAYQRRIEAFGWRTIVVDDGHDLARLLDAYTEACTPADAPSMLIANTIKGKGVAELEDQPGWHGKALDEEQPADALGELGAIDEKLRGKIAKPALSSPAKPATPASPILREASDQPIGYALGDEVATREAFGQAMKRLLHALLVHEGLGYLRTTREKTAVIYDAEATFALGGSHTLRQSADDELTIVAAGITLHEALKAHERLQQASIAARVIDLYSIKPLDVDTLKQAAAETGIILVVEDHFAEGGIGEAVRSSLEGSLIPIHHLAVRKRPRSGSPERLRAHQAIDADAITKLAMVAVRDKALGFRL